VKLAGPGKTMTRHPQRQCSGKASLGVGDEARHASSETSTTSYARGRDEPTIRSSLTLIRNHHGTLQVLARFQHQRTTISNVCCSKVSPVTEWSFSYPSSTTSYIIISYVPQALRQEKTIEQKGPCIEWGPGFMSFKAKYMHACTYLRACPVNCHDRWSARLRHHLSSTYRSPIHAMLASLWPYEVLN
jgi:hypothetical protein